MKVQRYVEITDLTDDENFVFDNLEKLKISYEGSIDLLNALSEENYRLKQTVAQLLNEMKETKEHKYVQPYAIMKKDF